MRFWTASHDQAIVKGQGALERPEPSHSLHGGRDMSDPTQIELLEQWLPVVGFDGYDVSNRGRVRSWRDNRRTRTPYILKPQIIPDGYHRVGLYRGDRQKSVFVAHLVAEAFIGPRPDGLIIRHLDGTRDNNRPENLKYGTHKENSADRARHGTTRFGENHGMALLTENDVRMIRQSKEQAQPLADRLGVSKSTIYAARTRQNWRHVS